MSGKYTRKNTSKRSKTILITVVLLSLLLAGLLLFLFWMKSDKPGGKQLQEEAMNQTIDESLPEHTDSTDETASESAESQVIFDLGSDIKITALLSYTGAFVEDGTDDIVTDVLAIQVTNSGSEYVQAMDITLTAGETEAQFSLSTLFPGETALVLEKNRMAYSTAPEFEQAQTSTVALFDGHPGMCQEKLEIQCLDGVINVTNISGEDITGDILIYYKNYVDGLYYGGITYRVSVKGGIKAGQIYQGTAAHFKPDNSVIVFVTCE